MNFAHRCTIPVARETLWNFLMDVSQMAACVPGVEDVTRRDGDQYAGRMRVKVGPVSLTMQGVMTIQERDQQQWRAAARAEANDRRVGGGVHVTAHMTLVENAPTETDLAIQAEARLLGKLGEFGQPVIRKKADAIVAEFARNVAARFHDQASAAGTDKPRGEAPVVQHGEPHSETPLAQRGEPQSALSPSRFSAGVSLIGMLAGLGLAVLVFTTVPLPSSPVLSWSVVGIGTVGAAVLGAIAAPAVRKRV